MSSAFGRWAKHSLLLVILLAISTPIYGQNAFDLPPPPFWHFGVVAADNSVVQVGCVHPCKLQGHEKQFGFSTGHKSLC